MEVLPLDLTDAVSLLAELLYSWTRQMPQVGGVVLPLDLTDAAGMWSNSAAEFDRCTGGWRLLYSWTRQMPQVGGIVLPLDLTDAAGRWSCSALGFDRCHMWVDCPWI